MAVSGHRSDGTTFGAALRDLKDSFFVGRGDECRLFAGCLRAPGDDWRILNIHGPGGVGKTTLLDAFRRLAEEAGALYVYLDVLDLPRSPAGMVARLAAALNPAGEGKPTVEDCLRFLHEEAARRPVVLAVDTYEEMGALDRWFREAFLARLPARAVVAVAGRFPLRGIWRESPAWRQLVRDVPLAPFDLNLTRKYLALHGVDDPALVRTAWEFTRGHPLALSLAAALVRQEGPAALARTAERPEVVVELTRRWLREVPDGRLRALLEAAAPARRFDQELLEHLTGTRVTPGEFARLTALSFVRLGRSGWNLHSLVRSTLLRELRWRSPARLGAMRERALGYHARMLTRSENSAEWGTTLEELFYLLGDALVRAVFFHDEDEEAGLHVVPSTPADREELQAYFGDCRRRAEADGPVEFEMVDPNTGSRFNFTMPWVDFLRAPLDISGLASLGPGVVRMARDAAGTLRGISVVIPVNATTLTYLEAQPVTGPYFRGLGPAERAEYAVPEDRTAAWYIRHINTRDLGDAAARSALFRDLFQIAFRDGRLLSSSPVPFFQDVLRRCGFVEVPGATHHDFGPEFPSPTYLLDVRGPRLAAYLLHLLRGGKAGDAAGGGAAAAASAGAADAADPATGALAAVLAERLAAWAAENANPAPVRDAPGRNAAVRDARARAGAGHDATGRKTILESLTPREREVARAVLDGLANVEVADRLGISLLTVKKHLTRVFEKAGVASRTQLIRKLLADGF